MDISDPFTGETREVPLKDELDISDPFTGETREVPLKDEADKLLATDKRGLVLF